MRFSVRCSEFRVFHFELDSQPSTLNPQLLFGGRGGEIRTRDHLHPIRIIASWPFTNQCIAMPAALIFSTTKSRKALLRQKKLRNSYTQLSDRVARQAERNLELVRGRSVCLDKWFES